MENANVACGQVYWMTLSLDFPKKITFAGAGSQLRYGTKSKITEFGTNPGHGANAGLQ